MSKDKEKLKPTEIAQLLFSRSAVTSFPGYASSNDGIGPKDLAMVLHDIAGGLEQMAIGLRATYMLLERVNDKLESFDSGLARMFAKSMNVGGSG